jgi:sulfur carrier protein
MNITINGEQRSLEDGLNLLQLIALLKLENKRLAIEVNQQIVPRSEHASYTLRADDKVEIVQAIGGG